MPKAMQPVKLSDKDGKHLGILYIPASVFDNISPHHEVMVVLHDIPPIRYSMGSFDPNDAGVVTYVSFSSLHRDGSVVLWGKQPEELNKYDGYFFMRSPTDVS